MKKIVISLSMLAAGVALSGTAYAGTKAASVPKGFLKAGAVPHGLQNALSHANEHGRKGIENAMKKQSYKSKGC